MKNYDNNSSSFVRRFFSYWLDWYFSGILISISILISNYIFTGSAMLENYAIEFSSNQPNSYFILMNIISLILLFVYFVLVPLILPNKHRGQTIGNLLTKIKIINLDETEMSFKNLFLRNMIYFVLLQYVLSSYNAQFEQLLLIFVGETGNTVIQIISCIIGVVSIILCLISPKKQTLQDRLTNSMFITIK